MRGTCVNPIEFELWKAARGDERGVARSRLRIEDSPLPAQAVFSIQTIHQRPRHPFVAILAVAVLVAGRSLRQGFGSITRKDGLLIGELLSGRAETTGRIMAGWNHPQENGNNRCVFGEDDRVIAPPLARDDSTGCRKWLTPRSSRDEQESGTVLVQRLPAERIVGYAQR